MINVRKFISIISFALIIAALLFAQSVSFFAADSYISLYGFTFDIDSNNEATIHKYDDRSANLVIPEKLMSANVTAIDQYAFYGDEVITSVSFENAVQLREIGVYAFYGCKALETLNIPSFISTVQSGTFRNCSGLKSAVIADGLTSIDDQAFAGCSSLEYIEIPDSVTSISDSAFKNCNKLVIYCNEGSYAQSYAMDNKIPYLLIREYQLGDANLDGSVNIRDVTYIQLYRAGLIDSIPTFRGRNYADVTKDGKVNIRDATMIQLKNVGLISGF